MNKVYKPLVRTEDGRLVSIFARRRPTLDYPELEYKEGTITYAPEGTRGIWTSPDLERGKKQKENATDKLSEGGTFVVHEATPLGNPITTPTEVGAPSTRYPAILLGKEVWREEPSRPKAKFRVGDKVIVVESPEVTCAAPRGTTVTIAQEVYFNPHTKQWVYLANGGLRYEENWLEPAPKEEWKDVTGECRPSLNVEAGCLCLYHNAYPILSFGSQRPWAESGGRRQGYKVEFIEPNTAPTHCCYGSFRIWKKIGGK